MDEAIRLSCGRQWLDGGVKPTTRDLQCRQSHLWLIFKANLHENRDIYPVLRRACGAPQASISTVIVKAFLPIL
jgi:hypothetical protein